MAPEYLIPQKRVVLTFICNGITRRESALILLCSLHCIDTHIEDALAETNYRTTDEMIAKCILDGLVRTLSTKEKKDYLQIAEYNQKHIIKRANGEPIPWQQFYDELYSREGE